MKLWEILPQLKEGQTISVTYKDGSQGKFIYANSGLRRADSRLMVSLHDYILEANYELIPQFIPFEEALAELRKGKTICCKHDRMLPSDSHWSGELFHITIAPDSPRKSIDTDIMLNGKWWVVK